MMEDKKAYGLTIFLVSVFVILMVVVMSYSLWRDKQINIFIASNLSMGVNCDKGSQRVWIYKYGERVDLKINSLPLYCNGHRFEVRSDTGKIIKSLDKDIVYKQLLRQPL